MAKVVLNPVNNLQNETSALNTINTNSDRIEAAMENTLSRDGTSPNEMNSNIDMNDHRVFNIGTPVADGDAVRLGDIEDIVSRVFEPGAVQQASQAEAEAGTSSTRYMTPERTTNHFNARTTTFTRDMLTATSSTGVKTKLGINEITPEDYGAVGDGVTNDSVAVSAAVAAAMVSGAAVRFDKIYALPTNVANLNSVEKVGSGAFVVDGFTFPITPTLTNNQGFPVEQRKLFVSGAGSDTNDGLSVNRPFATYEKLFASIYSWVSTTGDGGRWVVGMAAGTVLEYNKFIPNILCSSWIDISGPDAVHPTQPTAIIDGGGVGAFFIQWQHPTRILFRNILFRNYTGTALNVTDDGDVYCDNCHFRDSGNALRVTNGANGYFKGGLITGMSSDAVQWNTNTNGTLGYANSTQGNIRVATMASGAGQVSGTTDTSVTGLAGHYVFGKGIQPDTTFVTASGTSFTLSKATTAAWVSGSPIGIITNAGTGGPVIFNNLGTNGIYNAENSALHVDWVTAFGNGGGITLLDSRSNVSGSNIQYNSKGIWRRGSGTWIPTTSTIVQNNTINFAYADDANVGLAPDSQDQVGLKTAPRHFRSATSSATIVQGNGVSAWYAAVANAWSVDPLWFRDPGKLIRLKLCWKFQSHGGAGNVSASGMTVGCRFNTSNIGLSSVPSGTTPNSTMVQNIDIRARGAQEQVVTMDSMLGTAARSSYTILTFTMPNDPLSPPTLSLGANITDAGDSALLEDWVLYLGGA